MYCFTTPGLSTGVCQLFEVNPVVYVRDGVYHLSVDPATVTDPACSDGQLHRMRRDVH